MENAAGPERPDHDPLTSVPRPSHPPTGAIPLVPPRPHDAPGEPPRPAVPPHPAAPAAPAPASLELDESPAAVLRSAVSSVPGVVAVGEPVSRALGRLREAIGQAERGGVEVAEGSEQIAVDISIVTELRRPLRATARAAQAAAAARLASSGREVTEVNVEVLDVEAAPAPAAPEAGDAASGTVSGSQGSGDASASDAPAVPGHVRVSTRALRSVATRLAAETFAVPARRIGVVLSDEGGDLALRLNLPLPVEPLVSSHTDGSPAPPAASVRERALGRRAGLRARFQELTGTALSRVDVRVTGVLDPNGAAA